jgi:hypothetical protein
MTRPPARSSWGSRTIVSLGRFFLQGLFIFLVLPMSGSGQTTNPVPAGMTAEQIEMQKKLGVATAAAQQDPAVQAAFQKAMKALRESDELMYKKIKQIDPSLTEFVDKMLKAKYPDAGQGK